MKSVKTQEHRQDCLCHMVKLENNSGNCVAGVFAVYETHNF